MITVALPAHLRALIRVSDDVLIDVVSPATMSRVLDVLEEQYPALRGTIREYGTGARRPYLRFFAAQEDISLLPMNSLLPQSVADGSEPLIIVGAIAGG